MAGFDQAIEKLHNLNRELQEKSERDRKVAELQALSLWLLTKPAASLRQTTADSVRTRTEWLARELTLS